MSCGFYSTILPSNETSYIHADNVYADYTSSSDARLKTDLTEVSGAQALNVLSNIQGQTYWREDLSQRRLGLIADSVQTAIAGLAIDNVVSSNHATFNDVEDEYKTLDYSRLVSLCIPATNTLNQQVTALTAELDALKSRLPKKKNNGTSSLSSK